VEVDGWTKFTECFTHLHSGNAAKAKEVLLAAIMADATNQGMTKMAEACSGLSYEKLCWTADWHIREETYVKALAELSNLQHRLLFSGARPALPCGPAGTHLFLVPLLVPRGK
jgi:hypothetical protein